MPGLCKALGFIPRTTKTQINKLNVTGLLLWMLLLLLLLYYAKHVPLSCAVQGLCPDPSGPAPFQRRPQHPDLSPLSWGAAPFGISQTQTCGSHPLQTLPQTLGWRLPLPAQPATPSRPRQRAASPTLILTLRKVPIVRFQSCFKVTLISKLLAALAGDYSCINQGEIMPVTD